MIAMLFSHFTSLFTTVFDNFNLTVTVYYFGKCYFGQKSVISISVFQVIILWATNTYMQAFNISPHINTSQL